MDNYSLKKYTYKCSDKFNEICKPILEYSPITFCSIGRIFNDGTYTGFMSDPLWTDLYLSKHYLPTLSLWAEHKIGQAKIGYDLWSISAIFTINSDTKELLQDCHLFNYNNGISIIDEHPDYYEVTTFASPKFEGIDSFFIEKIDVLRNYILFIKEKILSDNELSKEFNTNYILPPAAGIVGEQNHQIMKELDIAKYYLGYPLPERSYLTKRELDCLIPFILGLPKKDVALHLNISVRTIEAHLENIKNKCHIADLARLRLLFLNNRFISAMLPNVLRDYL